MTSRACSWIELARGRIKWLSWYYQHWTFRFRYHEICFMKEIGDSEVVT
jgi:hypothetical protein